MSKPPGQAREKMPDFPELLDATEDGSGWWLFSLINLLVSNSKTGSISTRILKHCLDFRALNLVNDSILQ